MTFRYSLLCMMMVAFFGRTNAAPSYYIRCFEDMQKVLHLSLPDSMGVQTENDSTWNFRGQPLRVSTNRNADISHIGYRLFNREIVRIHPSRLVLKFIERYALEYDLHYQCGYKMVDVTQFHISFIEGNASMLKRISPDDPINIEQGKQCYMVECGSGSHHIRMKIPCDYQLLTGSDAIELEEVMARDLVRIPCRLVPDTLPARWKESVKFIADTLAMVSEGCFLNEMIHSNLYLYKAQDTCQVSYCWYLYETEQNGWKPSTFSLDKLRETYRVQLNSLNKLHAVGNILLTGCAPRLIPLDLTFNRYGYKKSQMKLTLQQYIVYCQSEGCCLYVGFKQVTPEKISATLFAYNKALAYNHMLSLEFPVSLLEKGEGRIKGELYAYTPLQNVTKDLFINTETQRKP